VAAVLATALSAVLSLAGCGGSSTPSSGSTSTSGPSVSTTASTASGDAAVAWVDKVCGELVRFTESQAANPPNVANSDPAQALKAFDQYMSANIEQVQQTITNLGKVGPPPVTGGGQSLTALLDGLEALKAGYQTVKDKFAGVNPNDPKAAQTALVEALTSLGQGGEEFSQAMESIDSNTELDEAAKKAPNCQKLDDGSTTATTTATTTS
jgi:hypothetical protein